MVLTVSSALSPVIGLCCHRRLANTFAKLDASVEASGPHDFAVRSQRFRQRRRQRPSHPAPTSVTIAKRPSCRRGMAGNMDLIWAGRETLYFCRRDWTGRITLIQQENFLFTVSGRNPGADRTERVECQKPPAMLLLTVAGGHIVPVLAASSMHCKNHQAPVAVTSGRTASHRCRTTSPRGRHQRG